MRAGDLSERVDIDAPAHASDGAGGQVDGWTPLGAVWAEVLPTGGREQAVAGAMQSVEAFRVTIRFRADLTPFHRLRWRGRVLHITGNIADPDGRRERLVAFCTAGLVA